MTETATKRKVIVVDDERLITDTLAAILNLNGYEAQTFYSGEEAVEWARSSRPDIVLSDVLMRRMDGVNTALHIRNLHPECRIILFSAYRVSDSEQVRIDESGFEFLPRPLHPKDVLERLRSAKKTRVIPWANAFSAQVPSDPQ